MDRPIIFVSGITLFVIIIANIPTGQGGIIYESKAKSTKVTQPKNEPKAEIIWDDNVMSDAKETSKTVNDDGPTGMIFVGGEHVTGLEPHTCRFVRDPNDKFKGKCNYCKKEKHMCNPKRGFGYDNDFSQCAACGKINTILDVEDGPGDSIKFGLDEVEEEK